MSRGSTKTYDVYRSTGGQINMFVEAKYKLFGITLRKCSGPMSYSIKDKYDFIDPFLDGKITLSGTCSSKSVSAGGSTTCVGKVTATGNCSDVTSTKPYDGYSGIGSGLTGKYTTSTTVSSTSKSITIKCVDNAKNTSTYSITLKNDTTKCSSTTISITGGTSYRGYYVGTVTCSAKCTKDNLKVGSTKTGTTTGTSCSANACDAAGNCTKKTISVKRDSTAPTCSLTKTTPEGIRNGYYMGKVTATWTGKDGQSGFNKGSTTSKTFTASTNSNTKTSLTMSIEDSAGNSKTCPTSSFKRDTTAPSQCSYSQSDFSNSKITATAKCSSDGQSGCSPDSHSKTYTANGTYTGANGINVYDMTEKYGATPKNYKQCPITINKIDKAAPSCTAKINIANPVLSADKKTWTTNTWHNNQDYIYDENGKATANSKKRVQASLSSSSDNATSGGVASGIKGGYVGGQTLNGEAQTTLSEGNQNGVYTVFVRDKVVDTVVNPYAGWSGSTLY